VVRPDADKVSVLSSYSYGVGDNHGRPLLGGYGHNEFIYVVIYVF
jgi:hypothetical protein